MTRLRRSVLVVLLVICLAFLAFGIPRPDWAPSSPTSTASTGTASLPSRGSPSGGTPQAKALAQSLSTFGFNLLLRQAGASAGNIAISPVSLASVLSMVRNGANGQTGQELAQALGVASLDPAAVNQGWADLITAAQSGKATSVAVCNSLWLHDGFPFQKAFLQTNQEYYAADCLPLNNDDAAAVGEINQWVSQRTSGQIQKLFDSIDPGTDLLAVNTVNLKVGWQFFKESDTKSEPFKTAAGTSVTVDMMHAMIKTQSKIVAGDDFSAVCLKTDSPVDVWVIVPLGDRTPEDIMRTLAQTDGVSGLYNNAQSREDVQIALPRFEFSYARAGDALVGDLEALGIKRLFTPAAELQGIADVPTPLYVTSVSHLVHIKLDEKGVEAQAASGIQVGCGALPPFVVSADHPFLVVLAESSSQAPLFLAIVRDPS